MTSKQPDAAAHPSARPLRRRATDRVIGGVASGIGDNFNIDPLLVRAAFVGLMIFGGAGLVLYVGAWLLIPVEGEEDSIAESALRRLGMHPGSLVTSLVLIGFLVFIAFVVLPNRGGYIGWLDPGYYLGSPIILIGAMVVLGVLLLRRGGGTRRSNIVATTDVVDAAAPATIAQRTVVVREPRPRVPRGPLGWYTLAAALLGIGLLAAVDNLTDATVMPGQFFGTALAIVGIGLVFGSWWGSAGLLILPALLLLPVAVAASFVTVPLEGGTGYSEYTPATPQEVRAEYRKAIGEVRLDLRELEPTGEPIRIAVSIGIGDLDVILPEGASVDVTADVGAGGLVIAEMGHSGTSIVDRSFIGEGATDPDFILDLRVGIGRIEVWPGEWYDRTFAPPEEEPLVEATGEPHVEPSGTPPPSPTPTPASTGSVPIVPEVPQP